MGEGLTVRIMIQARLIKRRALRPEWKDSGPGDASRRQEDKHNR